MEVLCKLNSIFGLFKDAPEAIPQQLTSETGCFQIQSFDWIGNLWLQIRMPFFRNPHPEIPMPFSFFTITLHFCTSDMVDGLFPQMWANCGIFVEQSQSFHRFSARWKNCCKRGNLSTKNRLTDGWIGKWHWEMDCPRCAHAHRKRCRTRCFDSTAFHALHGFRRDLLPPLQKKAPRLRCVIFEMVVGDGFEPSKDVLADLQSAPFGHSGIPPI